VLVGCDKTIPAGAMARARLDVPGIIYGGSLPGPLAGQDVTIQDVFEAVGAFDRIAGARNLVRSRTPLALAACGGQFTRT
jgi:dihydroxy-acid dehydratase